MEDQQAADPWSAEDGRGTESHRIGSNPTAVMAEVDPSLAHEVSVNLPVQILCVLCEL